jgi:hypothetical protein
MCKFDEKDINHFVSFFKDFSGQTGWIIKIQGRVVKLNSGKSLWGTKRHAKLALKNHLDQPWNKDCFLTHLTVKYFGKEYHPDDHQLWLNFLAFAERAGILEFVELK